MLQESASTRSGCRHLRSQLQKCQRYLVMKSVQPGCGDDLIPFGFDNVSVLLSVDVNIVVVSAHTHARPRQKTVSIYACLDIGHHVQMGARFVGHCSLYCGICNHQPVPRRIPCAHCDPRRERRFLTKMLNFSICYLCLYWCRRMFSCHYRKHTSNICLFRSSNRRLVA